MNSLQKQLSDLSTDTTHSFVEIFESFILKADLNEAELVFKKLKFLGLNYDPFAPEASSECRQIMDNLGITIHLSNPYLATNILLQLLDKTEERINNLKQ